jgi:hypothetical protein
MQLRMTSGHCERITAAHDVFPEDEDGHKRFGTLTIRGERAGDPHPSDVSVFVNKAADLDAIIDHATALRRELAEAEEVALVEAAERQMEQRQSEHERADADGEVEARPHLEDAHADSAPLA